VPIIESIINSFKQHNDFITKLENLQILILCIVCSIIMSPKVIIDTVINFIGSIINKDVLLIGLFIGIIPCTGPAISLLEQIINEIYIYFKPQNDKPIDLGPLQILLLLLNLISFQPSASNTQSSINNISLDVSKINVKYFASVASILKKYYKDIKDFNIENIITNIKTKIEFNTYIIKFNDFLQHNLEKFNNNYDEFKKEFENHIINLKKDIDTHVDNFKKGLVYHQDNLKKGFEDSFKKLFWGGGNLLEIQFRSLKNINILDLFIQFLKLLTSKEINNIILISFRLLFKFFKDNTDLLFKIFKIKSDENLLTIFDIWYYTIDSILCFLLLINNFKQTLINALKIIIHNYFGPELSGFSSIICNFIQTIFDMCLNHTCNSSIISIKNTDIIIQNKIKQEEIIKRRE
jgi:hypothetical protein